MARKLRRSKNGTAAESSSSTPSSAPDDAGPKKRGRPKLTVKPMGNVSDETIREQLEKCVGLRAKLDSVQGEYRAAVKACRNVGLEPADVVWFIRARVRDVQEIDQETRRRTRLAVVMGLPLGTQLGLFEDGESAATKAESATFSSEETIARARHDGARDGAAGKSAAGAYEDGSPEQLAYDAAWQQAQRELAERSFGNAQPAATA